MRRPATTRWCRIRLARLRRDGEKGQVLLLVLGFTVVALLLVVGAVDVTALQLARIRLTDAADGAALASADELDRAGTYRLGVDRSLRVGDGDVRAAATAYLQVQGRPQGVSDWQLLPGTGSPDGRSAVVRLQGTAQVPLLSSVVSALGDSITITVQSRARAEVR